VKDSSAPGPLGAAEGKVFASRPGILQRLPAGDLLVWVRPGAPAASRGLTGGQFGRCAAVSPPAGGDDEQLQAAD